MTDTSKTRIWTEEQQQAIETKGKTLLVSAAAGSGKTATLTERVIRRISDREHPVGIDELLIVTFTKAAAGELRARLEAALRAAIAADPTDRYLSRQLLSISRADINTISAFCLETVRQNAHKLPIATRFSLMDDAEHQLLQAEIMESLIDDAFAGKLAMDEGNGFDISYLSDIFGSVKNRTRLRASLLKTHQKLQNLPRRQLALRSAAEQLTAGARTDFLNTVYGQYIRDDLCTSLDAYQTAYSDALRYFEGEDVYRDKYLPAFRYEYEVVCSLRDALQSMNYLRAREELLHARGGKIGAVRRDKATPEGDCYKAMRDSFRDACKNWFLNYFIEDAEKLPDLCLRTAECLMQMYHFLDLYEKRLLDEKYRRREYGFSDIEQFTLKLLYDAENDCPTETALEIGFRYREIYIDEYQDVSPLQDLIFRSLAQADNRFMVGDIKQSIYAFRGATPELFLRYRNIYAGEDPNGKTLFLSRNFRSDPAILKLCNTVFSTLFPILSPSMQYRAEDQLTAGIQRNAETISQKTIPLALFTKQKSDEETNADEIDPEAAYVAGKIACLLQDGTLDNGEKIHRRDIAILLRSDKTAALQFEKALAKYGIESYNQAAGSFFENGEILLFLSLLHTIDNPYDEIWLAAVLKSPLFLFTLDDLIYIRRKTPSVPLITALERFTEETGFAKGKYFLTKLDTYRKHAIGASVDALIWYLFCDSGMMSLVYEKEDADPGSVHERPEQMRANLLLLYDYARRFEHSRFRGLSAFLKYAEDIIREKQRVGRAVLSAEQDDVVRIISVHQSKGLEFPICFLCDLGRRFNRQDMNENPVYQRTLGFGVSLRDESGFIHFTTPIREAVSLACKRADEEEELRILYVAMTRAKEQLYLSAAVENPDTCMQRPLALPLTMFGETVRSSSSLLEWLLACASIEDASLAITVDPEAEEPRSEAEEKVETDATPMDVYTREIERRLEFVYPYREAVQIPSKLAVSKLYPGILEEFDTSETLSASDSTVFQDILKQRPAFLQDSETADGADKGTATHVFLQFCQFSSLCSEGFEAERLRLLQGGWMTERDSALVRQDWIEQFCKSDVFQQMLASSHLEREKRFHCMLPAAMLSDRKDGKPAADLKVLVQGVIDCLYENQDGSYTVLDYKTDAKPHGMTTEAFCELLRTRYRTQLTYYRTACEILTQKKVSRLLLYSFAAGLCITLD